MKSAEEKELYGPTDEAIKTVNRRVVTEFGKLKLADFDKINVVQSVTRVYRTLTVTAKKQYRRVAKHGYATGLLWYYGLYDEPERKAEKAVTEEWLDGKLEQPDPVTKYAFDTETERKAQRLIEALAVSRNPGKEIDVAMRYLSRQFGQYAINVADEGLKQAYEDENVTKVRWVTAGDEKVCEDCRPLDGKVFLLEEVPPKPHWNCRCFLVPVRD